MQSHASQPFATQRAAPRHIALVLSLGDAISASILAHSLALRVAQPSSAALISET